MSGGVLRLTDRVTMAPVIHGSGDFALAVRRLMLEQKFDCVAVPLPPSFQTDVERAIACLPRPTVVIQQSIPQFRTDWSPDDSDEDDTQKQLAVTYPSIRVSP